MSRVEHGSVPRLDAILARAALSDPKREAVVFNRQSWSYGVVHDRARRLAGALTAIGVKKGDRVALWTHNRPEFVEVFYGVPMLGAICAPLDFWWGWKDANVALSQIRPKVLIVGPAQAAIAAQSRAVLRDVGIEHVLCLDEAPEGSGFKSYVDAIASAERLKQCTPVVASDPAVILFTSGSTGRSKGAVHTHGSLTATASTMCLELGLGDGERTLHFLPLFSSCLEHLLPLTLVRATHIVLPHFDEPAVWETIRDAKVTHFDAVPTTLRRLLKAAPAEIPSSLSMISYASERMPEPLIKSLMERMPTVRFVQFYGMIEHLCLTVLTAADHRTKTETVGRPMFGAQLYCTESGEIVARSPTMFAGYWQDPETTSKVMVDQWMRTGDVGSFDDDGFLRLKGRVKEIIKSGGMTVIPNEIEAALMAHPRVSDAAVVGVPDEQWGEAVHAFVILSSAAAVSEADLKVFCQENLAGYKRPKAIHIVADLPRTGIGKIARRVVRERLLATGSY
ncbi:class I adenylate-forming enzyme family protein [Peristeroidobacter soli]|uniref:class I adenylate-forming enzyme family protein n=1 Tax=Peristeroidobacter soli TaxID=2497877 RepID=UPI00101C7644|nr:class I adenylate-forming enzyme family protein [Peristeroidobacter soli]